MKRYTLLILSVIWAFSLETHAQEQANQWFEQANAAYNAGRYDSAMMMYEQVLQAELESVPLYYNMGNTYYKMREYPMAIYCYEKALKLDPGNDDVKTNLAIANLAIVDKIEEVPQSFIAKGWQRLKAMLSGDQWAVLSLVAFALMLASAYLFLRSRRMGLRKLGFFAGIVLLLVVALSVVFASQQKQASLKEDHAIVMPPTVTVKSSPNEESVDLFVLHEGTKVTLLDQADGWNKVRIGNGSVGWLQAETMLPF